MFKVGGVNERDGESGTGVSDGKDCEDSCSIDALMVRLLRMRSLIC